MVNITYDASGSLISTYSADMPPAVYNPGDIAWILASTALVMIMSPGVGYLYSGLLRRKNALSMLYLSLAVYCVVSIQWFFWGYSLAFSATGGKFIGNLQNFGFINVLDQPSNGNVKIPALLYALYQSMFAAITPILMIGGSSERGRLGPLLIVVFIWSTLVYDPVANWIWNANGFFYQLGALDFAGGGPVHMTSGTGALAMGIYLGKRRGWGTERLSYRPHSVSHVVLGTVLLWFGWFGFNGGSACASGLRAIQASMVTNLAASSGGMTWLLMDYYYSRRWSAVSLCSGIVTGLIAITPASGYVGSPAALLIGIVGSIAANYATKLKHIFKFDDTLDVFSTHCIGGFVGSLLTGLFADSRVAGFDGTVIPGGWINQNYIQLAYQLALSVTIIAYTFVMTMIILIVVDHIPGLHLRASEEAEIIGLDEHDCGEASYDYAFVQRDVENPHEHTEWLEEKRAALSSSQAGGSINSSHQDDTKEVHPASPIKHESVQPTASVSPVAEEAGTSQV